MHQISEYSVQLAQAHAKQAKEHGKSVEACGKALQQRNQNAQEYGQLIEEYGKIVQDYAQQSYMYVISGGGNVFFGTTPYVNAVQANVKAREAHIQAVRWYTRGMREKLKEGSKRV